MSAAPLQLSADEILASVPFALLISTPAGEICYASATCTSLLGYTQKELVRLQITDLVPDHVRSFHHKLELAYQQAPFARTLNAGQGSIQVRTKNRKLIHVDITLNHTLSEQGEMRIISILQDAQMRVSLESEMLSAKAQLNDNITEVSENLSSEQELIWRCNAEGYFVYLSDRWFDVLGFTLDEMLGHLFSEFILPSEIRSALSGFNSDIENKRINQGYHLTFVNTQGEQTYLLLKSVPVYDRQGNVMGLQGSATDITSLKIAREIKQRMEDRLQGLQRHETLGRLVSGISHEFNNLLQVIMSNAAILRTQTLTSDALSMINQILGATERGIRLTNQLTSFGDVANGMVQAVNVNDRVTISTKLLNRLVDKHCEVEMDLAEELLCVMAETEQIDQIIINLVLNANESTVMTGKIHIHTMALDQDHQLLGKQKKYPNGAVLLVIEDDGNGMGNKTKSMALEPFFTTKTESHATGLGLATVQNILHQIGGEIFIDTTLGQGTSIKLIFPSIAKINKSHAA